MEERKIQTKQIRGRMNQVGATLIVYYLIMNVAVILAVLADAIIYLIRGITAGTTISMDTLQEYVTDAAKANGWGYILAIVAGCIIVLLWKGKDFCFREIFTRDKKMSPGTFLKLLCVFVVPQALLQLYAPAFEWLLNQIGFSAMNALEMATINGNSLSLFLYISFLGPLSEELLFRGVLLRLLRPYGKQAAIVISAILFGLFHGNFIQIPFAFCVGLVLGYVTVEYSIVWAIALHIINNFVLSDLMGLLAQIQPAAASILLFAIILICTITAFVLLIDEKETVSAYFRENKVGHLTWKGMLTSPVLWIFTAMMLGSSLLTITKI